MSTGNILSSTSASPRFPAVRFVTHPEPLMRAEAELLSSSPRVQPSPGITAERCDYVEPSELSSTREPVEIMSSRRSRENGSSTRASNIPLAPAHTVPEPIVVPPLPPLPQPSQSVRRDPNGSNQEQDGELRRASRSRNQIHMRPHADLRRRERDRSPVELPASPPPTRIQRGERLSQRTESISARSPRSVPPSRSTWGPDSDWRSRTIRPIASQNLNRFSDSHNGEAAAGRNRSGPLSAFESSLWSSSGYMSDEGTSLLETESASQLGGGSVCNPNSFW